MRLTKKSWLILQFTVIVLKRMDRVRVIRQQNINYSKSTIDTLKKNEMCSKFTIKTQEQGH